MQCIARYLILTAFVVMTAITAGHAQVVPGNPANFITIWQTDIDNTTGTSNPDQITIPTTGSGYKYDIYWENTNDPSDNGTLEGLEGSTTITFPRGPGTYRIEIAGVFPRIFFNGTGDRRKILSVEQWGDIQWTSMVGAFFGAQNLVVNAKDAPDLSNVTSLLNMFRGASSLNDNLNHWNVSSITNMEYVFAGASGFNGDLSDWDVSNVTTMRSIFSGASAFNRDISMWDVSNVEFMSNMFNGASLFNQDIGYNPATGQGWDVRKVTTMDYMFRNASSFNGDISGWQTESLRSIFFMFQGATNFNADIGGWDVSGISGTRMEGLFLNASSFNQNLSDWDVSNVTSMSSIFQGASSFNGDISGWDVSSVTRMNSMFSGASSFNGDISLWNTGNLSSISGIFIGALSFNQDINTRIINPDTPQEYTAWDVSGVSNMNHMFRGASSFNGDISDWDTGNVTTMFRMFDGAAAFNSDIGGWDVSSVGNMQSLFAGASSFNRDLSRWDVSNVTNMAIMFNNASAFDQSLGDWNIEKVTGMSIMLSNSGLSTENYDATLIGWSGQDVNSGIQLGANGLTYCAESERSLLISKGWNIVGDSPGNCAQIVDAGNSVADATSPHSADGIDPSIVTLKLADQAKEPISGLQEGDFQIGIKGSAVASDVSETATPGEYTFTVTNTVAETVTITIIAGGVELVQQPVILFTEPSSPGDPGNFITIWQTDIDNSAGTSNSDQITIPTTGTGYDYNIYWESLDDAAVHGTITDIEGSTTITFPQPGRYRVEISGSFPRIYFNSSGDRRKILSVEQWGDIQWTSMESAFFGTENLVVNANDAPDLGNMTSMRFMFRNASSLNSHLNHWDVSGITNMEGVFNGASSFNGDISDWNVSNVTNMGAMFSGASSFNRDITGWDVSNVERMTLMFSGASDFNQNIGYDPNTGVGWDVSNVTRMDYMFSNAVSFNGDISGWNTGSVTTMYFMFSNAASFNADIGGWDVSGVTGSGMEGMFQDATAFNRDVTNWEVSGISSTRFMFSRATSFNGDLSGWETTNITSMASMFQGASSFNRDISMWDVSSVTSMSAMFQNSGSFNQNIGYDPDTGEGWDVSNVTNMGYMFNNAAAFNGDIRGWDTGKVTTKFSMFSGAESFNADIGNWNVSSVQNMGFLFSGASSFNQGLGSWDISKVTEFRSMLSNTGLSTQNYDATLTGWSAQEVNSGVQLGAHGLTYCAETERSLLISKGWSIVGDSPGNCAPVVSAANSSVTATSPHLPDGMDASTVTIVLRDESNQPITGFSDDDFSIGLEGIGEATNAEATEVTETSTPGTYHFQVTNVSEDTVTVYVRADFVDLSDTPEIVFVEPDEPGDAFITTWRTNPTMFPPPGASADNQIRIPMIGNGYNFTVHWGDGTSEAYTADPGEDEFHYLEHTFPAPGDYQVSITGDFPRIYFSGSGDSGKILSVDQWGSIQWASMAYAFAGASRLASIPETEAPDLSNVESMERMFLRTLINSDLTHWDVSNVRNMRGLFEDATFFNGDISNWNVSNVTDMSYMFQDAVEFNGDIQTKEINVDEPDYYIAWDVSNVVTMANMFSAQEGNAFNADISEWDVSSVEDMSAMFSQATNFNQDISGWDVSSVTNMEVMFFGARSFNTDISGWNTASLNTMINMFEGAQAFDQSLGGWDVSRIPDMGRLFAFSNLSRQNYDATLIGWAAQDLESNVTLGAFGRTYCAIDARNRLISDFDWEIEGDALADDCPATFEPFVTTWKTDNTGPSSDQQIRIPMIGNGYDFTVDWGDGNTSTYSENPGEEATHFIQHTYAEAGEYTVSITGSFPRIYFNDGGDRLKLLTIEQWGDIAWSSMENAFNGATNLVHKADDAPNLSGVTSLGNMFRMRLTNNAEIGGSLHLWDVSSITDMNGMFDRVEVTGDITGWNTGNVVDMSHMFAGSSNFNQDISGWNTGNVVDMSHMFAGYITFNQDISGWDTKNVENMAGMFANTASFNRDISSWQTGNVTTMKEMFYNANTFNQPLNGWNVGNVTDFSYMFAYTSAFNQDLDEWDTSSAITMEGVFEDTRAFNGEIGTWNTSNVENMLSMFVDADLFNRDISTKIIHEGTPDEYTAWDVSNVKDMTLMFAFSKQFNQDIGNWNTGSVEIMDSMFLGAEAFNQDIGSWDVSSVIIMRQMFDSAESFNQDLSGWQTGNVSTMRAMFVGAESFNQSLGSWDVTGVEDMALMLNNSGLSRENYDLTLEGWAAQTVKEEVALGAVGRTYCAVDARNVLTDTYKWTITGDEPAEDCSEPVQVVDAEKSTVTATSPHIADGVDTSVAIVVVRDEDDQPITGLGNDDFLVELTGSAIASDVEETDTPGEYTFTVTNTVEENVTVTITVDGVALSDTPQIVFAVEAPAGESFVTWWETSDGEILIPVQTSGFDYNYDIYWEIADFVSGTVTHVTGDGIIQVPEPGVYRVEITGTFPRMYLGRSDVSQQDRDKLIDIEQWGDIEWESMEGAFRGARILEAISATDVPDLSRVESMREMFRGSGLAAGSLNHWDVSNVADMGGLFREAESFNGDISGWDVSSVTDMAGMFADAGSFNGNISGWDVSGVTDMTAMFADAGSFNRNLGGWDVSSVTDMTGMLDRSGLSRQNYDALLIAWAALVDANGGEPSGVNLGAEGLMHCAVEARANLVDVYEWEITGDTLAEDCDITPIVDAEKSTVSATTPHRADGQDASTVTIVLRDESDEPVAGLTDEDFTVDATGSPTRTDISETDIPGTYTFFVTSTAHGHVTLTVTAAGTELELKPVIHFLPDMMPFITTWETTDRILVPVQPTGLSYNYDIYWEKTDDDGISGIIAGVTGDGMVDVPESGRYRIEIFGEFPRIYLGRDDVDQADRDMLISVDQWGDIEWESMAFAFYGASNLEIQAEDAPDLSGVASLEGMFAGAGSFNGDISGWNVSSVIDMGGMFFGATSFNRDIGSWDVSSVQNMSSMFRNAASFNQDVGGWDVSGVANMAEMFAGAGSFNADITGWNVSTVSDMGGMFFGATSFNRDISGWDVSSVRNFGATDGFPGGGMFEDAASFDQDLSAWNISAVTGEPGEDMRQMLDRSGLSRQNYDALLNGWAALVEANGGEPSGINLGADGLTYCALTARSLLTDDFSWDIIGDALADDCEPEDIPVPLQPEILSLESADGGVRVTWQYEDEAFISGYRVYKGITPQALLEAGQAPGGTHQYVDQDPDEPVVFYAVSAVNTDDVEGPLSNILAYFSRTITADEDDWKLVSSPLAAGLDAPEFATVYGFDSRYELADELEPARGYWIKSKTFDPEEVPIRGPALMQVSLDLKAGWNLIGSLALPLPVDHIVDESAILTPAPVYGYAGNAYQPVDVLQPNEGYWIFADSDGMISLHMDTTSAVMEQMEKIAQMEKTGQPGYLGAAQSAGQSANPAVTQSVGHSINQSNTHHVQSTNAQSATGNLDNSATQNFEFGRNTTDTPSIRIEFQNEHHRQRLWVAEHPPGYDDELRHLLPPVAPGAGMDIRTSRGLSLVSGDREQIYLRTSTYPVTASIQGQEENPDYTWRILLQDDAGERAVTLQPGVPVVIAKVYRRIFIEKIRSDELPGEHQLMQNYPNPFNPTTMIPYYIAEQEHVSIGVYDVSGRRVMQLTDELHPPGMYQVPFDAAMMSSGVYLVRFQAGDQRQTRRITLIK